MKYNAEIHKRRSIRLKGYDYSKTGLYFVTICCQDRTCRFGKIQHNEMVLNEYGIIAHCEWEKLQERFNNFELDVFQIMPNHMHGIIALHPVGATLAVAADATLAVAADATLAVAADNTIAPNGNGIIRAGASPAPTVGDIAGAYKSLVSTACLEIYKSKNEIMGKLWQRNYYEHIIRNQHSYINIYNYILNNPAKWKEDRFYGGE